MDVAENGQGEVLILVREFVEFAVFRIRQNDD